MNKAEIRNEQIDPALRAAGFGLAGGGGIWREHA
jgi:hypothetical protein